MAYLASFLARGSFVDASLVSSSVQSLLNWAGQYLDQHDDALAAPAPTMSTPGPKVRVRCSRRGDVMESEGHLRVRCWRGHDGADGGVQMRVRCFRRHGGDGIGDGGLACIGASLADSIAAVDGLYGKVDQRKRDASSKAKKSTVNFLSLRE